MRFKDTNYPPRSGRLPTTVHEKSVWHRREWVLTDEVAEILGISKGRANQLLRERKLPRVLVGGRYREPTQWSPGGHVGGNLWTRRGAVEHRKEMQATMASLADQKRAAMDALYEEYERRKAHIVARWHVAK